MTCFIGSSVVHLGKRTKLHVAQFLFFLQVQTDSIGLKSVVNGHTQWSNSNQGSGVKWVCGICYQFFWVKGIQFQLFIVIFLRF